MEVKITNFQKRIYNSYLYFSRKNQNKPFKARKDFSKIENSDFYPFLIKLEKFFKRFPNIDIDLFFKSPYVIYGFKNHISLDYYLTRDALKAFTKYKKQIIFDDADSEYNLKKIIESLKYIKRFIREKDISLNEYLHYNSGQYLPDYVFHLKNDNISFYVLFGFENFEEEFSKISPEDKKDIFMDFYKNWNELKRKFYFSKVNKSIVRRGMKKISKKT